MTTVLDAGARVTALVDGLLSDVDTLADELTAENKSVRKPNWLFLDDVA